MVNIPHPEAPPKKKTKFKIKTHHGYSAVLFVFGTVFPPLAVAARFGIGTDFFLNLFLTICGYIPGHVHNFYIQNIRNNKNNRRTPKWAIRYGLVSDDFVKKKKKKSAWANRYEERLPHSTYEGREVDDGQVPDAPGMERTDSMASAGSERSEGGRIEEQRTGNGHNQLWTQEDESFYSNNNASDEGGGRWHYPANFNDSEIVPDVSRKRRKSKSSKPKSSKRQDRWERSEDAYASAATPTTPAPKKRKSTTRRRSEDSFATEGPEDPLGVGYGRREREDSMNGGGGNGGTYGSYGSESGEGQPRGGGTERDPLAHDF